MPTKNNLLPEGYSRRHTKEMASATTDIFGSMFVCSLVLEARRLHCKPHNDALFARSLPKTASLRQPSALALLFSDLFATSALEFSETFCVQKSGWTIQRRKAYSIVPTAGVIGLSTSKQKKQNKTRDRPPPNQTTFQHTYPQ